MQPPLQCPGTIHPEYTALPENMYGLTPISLLFTYLGTQLNSSRSDNAHNRWDITDFAENITRDGTRISAESSAQAVNSSRYRFNQRLDSFDHDPLGLPQDTVVPNPGPNFLPPRHRRPRNRQEQNEPGTIHIVREDDIVWIHDLPPATSEGDLVEKLMKLGFNAHW